MEITRGYNGTNNYLDINGIFNLIERRMIHLKVIEQKWWRTIPVATKARRHDKRGANTHACPAPTTNKHEGCRLSLHRLRTSSHHDQPHSKLTCRFCASLKHKYDGQTKFIKSNSQRQDTIIKYWVSIGSIHREQG